MSAKARAAQVLRADSDTASVTIVCLVVCHRRGTFCYGANTADVDEDVSGEPAVVESVSDAGCSASVIRY